MSSVLEIWNRVQKELRLVDGAIARGDGSTAFNHYVEALNISDELEYPYKAMSIDAKLAYVDFVYTNTDRNKEIMDKLEQILYDACGMSHGFPDVPEAGITKYDLVNSYVMCHYFLIVMKMRRGKYNDVRNICDEALRYAIPLFKNNKATTVTPDIVSTLASSLVMKLRISGMYDSQEKDLTEMRNDLTLMSRKYPDFNVGIDAINAYLLETFGST